MPTVTFHVPALPPGTPAGTLFLTGSFRGWADDPSGWTFRVRDGRITLSAFFPAGALLDVKVRVQRPDGHSAEEGDAWGGRAPAHKVVVGADDQEVSLRLRGWQDGQGAGRPGRARPPREEWTLAAPWGEQPVRVWWPEGRSPAGLPRLILHDGQNVFDEGPSFAGASWQAADAAQALADAGRPSLLVGLSVDGARVRRYMPFPIPMNSFQPGADEYLDWLTGPLLAELERRYGPLPAERRAMLGSSFGGVVTLYGGLRHPGVFGTLGVMSPSVWPDDHALLRWLPGRTAPSMRLWVDQGDHEGASLEDSLQLVREVRALAEQLRPAVREVHFQVGEGHWHDEAAWAARLPEFLAWWLGGLPPGGQA
ncbi:alpha/beta hydrolase [Deinococcus ficus]|uniref:alpha/beta hydrolase n=1 Tax=Deinococcus ficus TaxID=317577 RepID=UPI00174965A3|nr:alpha/beta hydrolase-fold protein [Deinococcus ficus]GHF84853.1 hypothetical protein GCM10017782_22920 [Deinococcus ficus]